MDGFEILKWALDGVLPVVTSLVGYFLGRKKRDNDFLADLQKSIDMLSAKNSELMGEVVTLRDEVIGLRKENTELKLEVGSLRTENGKLREEVAQLSSQLAGVKTITRVKKEGQ